MQSTDGAGVAPEDIDALGGELDEIEEADVAEDGEDTETTEAGDDEGSRDDQEEETRDVVEPPPRSRRAGRSERLRQELRERDERVDRLSRELETLRAGVQQPRLDPAAQARAAAEEQERVAALPYDQQIAYWRQKDLQNIGTYAQQLEARVQDQIDKSAWDAGAGIDPMRQRYSERVEREIQQARSQGGNPNRQTLYEWLVGKDVLARRASAVQGQRAAGRRRVASQTTRPAGSRGDGVRQNTRVRDDDEALLRGITVDDL